VRKLMLLAGIILISGCANFGAQKPLTKEDALGFNKATDLAEARYKQIGIGRWSKSEEPNHTVVKIIDSVYSVPGRAAYVQGFINEFTMFCELKKGEFKDFRKENGIRMDELTKKHSYQKEMPYYVCGPGEGTAEWDWTKFNPATCRKKYSTGVYQDKVYQEYGNPADFACIKNDGVSFKGSLRYRAGATVGGGMTSFDTIVTIHEGKNAPLPLSEQNIMN